jgi:structural toxin protein (hemagglutinin/hemolysin) RtxA
MYILVVYVPEAFLDDVREALFKAGCGVTGNYSRCAWQVKGTGQFLPGKDASPAVGNPGKAETVSEFRLEVVCPKERVPDAVTALEEAHPYETPAYHFLPAADLQNIIGHD